MIPETLLTARDRLPSFRVYGRFSEESPPGGVIDWGSETPRTDAEAELGGVEGLGVVFEDDVEEGGGGEVVGAVFGVGEDVGGLSGFASLVMGSGR